MSLATEEPENKKGYVLQPYPDYEINVLISDDYYFTQGRPSKHRPLATLKDEYGGIAHIIQDDGCYMLVLRDVGVTPEGELVFKATEWWFPEAVRALRKLPDPGKALPRDAMTEVRQHLMEKCEEFLNEQT